MSNLSWAVQTNWVNKDYCASIDNACRKLGLEFIPFERLPFSLDLPDVPNDRPVMFYGPCSLVQVIENSKHWSPGVLPVNTDWFNCQYDDEALLNVDGFMEYLWEQPSIKKPMFVRPLDDSKFITGQVFTPEEYSNWYNSLNMEEWGNQKFIYSLPKEIVAEYRCFVVGGQYSTGSLYKKDGEAKFEAYVPSDIQWFVNHMAVVYSPCEVYVMDVAVTDEAKIQIIELNGFNACGFYKSDVDKLLLDITQRVNW